MKYCAREALDHRSALISSHHHSQEVLSVLRFARDQVTFGRVLVYIVRQRVTATRGHPPPNLPFCGPASH